MGVPMLSRLSAIVLIVLCALPMTAPFATIQISVPAPLQAHACTDGAIVGLPSPADDDAIAQSESLRFAELDVCAGPFAPGADLGLDRQRAPAVSVFTSNTPIQLTVLRV